MLFILKDFHSFGLQLEKKNMHDLAAPISDNKKKIPG